VLYCRALLLLSSASLVLTGCEAGYNFPNEAPSQLSISKDACYVTAGEEVSLSGGAYDEDDDPIYYQWSATAGTFEPPGGEGPSVVWTAPQTPGTVTITLSVTDEIETSSLSETVEVGGSFPSFITESITIADMGYVYILDKLQPVEVPQGVTLTITQGVEIVVSNENGGIDVEGSMVIQGEQDAEVVIGPASCEPAKGEWRGIRIIGAPAYGSIAFARIHSADNGIIITERAKAEFNNCTIYNNLMRGIEVSDSASADMTRCTVWENETGVYVRNADLDAQLSSFRYSGDIGLDFSATSSEHEITIDTCKIANNETYGILMMGVVQPEIHFCSIYSNGPMGTGEAVRLEAYSATDSIRADNNFWGIGYVNQEDIATLIHDRNDVVTGIQAYIDFIPWLTSEPVEVP
jgi:hypothetical protein